MSLISLVLTLIVIGVLLWLINTYIPMDAKIKKIEAKEKSALKNTKELLAMDKVQDRKLASCKKKMRKKSKK